MIELAITALIIFAALGVATSLTTTTIELTKETHVQTRAHAEHRRNLLALSDILRTASVYSLDGFDVDGNATQPGFRRLLGVDLHDRLYTDPQHLEWRAASIQVNGVAQPGAVWLVDPEGDSLVADKVPSGGFVVRQEGNVLAIRLTTYYATDHDHATLITSETAVLLR
ncbi:MAG: hypothetical protein ACYTG6_06085, partial [Planctomycetota bacterium]